MFTRIYPYQITGRDNIITIKYLKYNTPCEIEMDLHKVELVYLDAYLFQMYVSTIHFDIKYRNSIFIIYAEQGFFSTLGNLQVKELYNQLINYQNQIKDEIPKS